MPSLGKKPAKRTGRKRRLAGWSLLVIGVLVTGVWVASRWWWFGYETPNWSVGCREGSVDIRTSQEAGFLMHLGWYLEPVGTGAGHRWFLPSGTDLSLLSANDEVNLRVVWYGQVLGGRHIVLLLWPGILALLLTGGFLLRSARRARRRAMTGVCLKCGYDLSGLAAGSPCPECGKAPAAAR